MKVAVVAHSGKTLGGGLPELRRVLEAEGVADPLWCEVPKSRKAPAQVRARARPKAPSSSSPGAATGWSSAASTCSPARTSTLAIVPAGTANLFATNLGIPQGHRAGRRDRAARRPPQARRRPLQRRAVRGHGRRRLRRRDDPRRRSGGLKDRLGRVAYVWTGSKNLRSKPFRAKIEVDGVSWYKGKASCILLGNVGELFGGVEAFEDARPDDGLLELGVVTAEGLVQWARTLARTAVGHAEQSPFVADDEGALGKVKLTARCSTSSTAATGRRSRRSRSRSSRPPSASACPVPSATRR